MWQVVLLQLFKMIANQLNRQPLSFAASGELRQQTFAHVAGATTDGLKGHDNRPCLFHNLVRPAPGCCNLFIGGVQAPVLIKVSDYAFSRLANFALGVIHVELPLQMLGERRWLSEKLFEGGRIFLILKLLRLVTGIEVILKLTSEIDFLERVARILGCKLLACFQAR